MDKKTPAERSANMSAVKNKNTRPELFVRSIMHKSGYRYSLHRPDLPGKPDLVLPKYNTVIFVNGCFWHSHKNCKKAELPKSNVDFWRQKIQSNVERDKKNYSDLLELGWRVLVIWSCSCQKKEVHLLFSQIKEFLEGNEKFCEIGEVKNSSPVNQ